MVQERVAPALVRLLPAGLLWPFGGRAIVELAEGRFRGLPWPAAEGPEAVLVKTGRSRMARLLRLEAPVLPEGGAAALVPGAGTVRLVAVSHDEVYASELFLDPAMDFLTGAG